MLIIPKCLRLEKIAYSESFHDAKNMILQNIIVTNKYITVTDKRVLVMIELIDETGLQTVLPIDVYKYFRSECNKIAKNEPYMYLKLHKGNWLCYPTFADYEVESELVFIKEQIKYDIPTFDGLVKTVFEEFISAIKNNKVHRMRTLLPLVQLRGLIEAVGIKRESNTFNVESINWFGDVKNSDGEYVPTYKPATFFKGRDDEDKYDIFGLLMGVMFPTKSDSELKEFFEHDLWKKEMAFTKENYYDKAK